MFARNRGVAAITNGCVESLRKSIGNCQITLIHTFVESFYPRKTTVQKNINISMDEDKKFVQLLIKMLIRTFLATVWRLLFFLHINADFLLIDKVLKEYEKADVVINLSYGDMFAYKREFYNQLLFFILAHQCALAILLKKPLIFYPQSIGPFESRFSKFIAKFILDHCNVVMVREEVSKDYVSKMKVSAPIWLVPDVSFMLKPAPDRRVSEIFFKENVKIERPLIGVAVRDNLSKQLNIISEVIDYLTQKMDANIVFIPHFSSSDQLYFYDPRYLAEKIFQKIQVKHHISSIKGEYTAEELRGLIGKCDLFIGAYMHANISALSMHVPTIAISYSHKTDGIMKLAGMSEFVLHVNDLNSQQLIRKIEKLYWSIERYKETLKQNIRILQEEAMRSGKFVRKVINSYV